MLVALTLREVLEKNDVFGLGYTLMHCLLGEKVMSSHFPDVTAAVYREWDLPELPAHISKGTKALLTRMVSCDPTRRPSIKYARVCAFVQQWAVVVYVLLRMNCFAYWNLVLFIVCCREASVRCSILLWSQLGTSGGTSTKSAGEDLLQLSTLSDVQDWFTSRRMHLAFGLNSPLTALQTALYTEFLLQTELASILTP